MSSVRSFEGRSRITPLNPFDEDDDQQDHVDDLKQYQQRIAKLEDASLASTVRALRFINEAQETGVKTAQELVAQGDKLKNVDEQLDKVNVNLADTQRDIYQMKSFWGRLRNKVLRGNSGSGTLSKSTTKMSDSSTKKDSGSKDKKKKVASEQRAEFVQVTGSTRENEIEQNIDEIAIGIGNLRSLALSFSAEMDRQAPVLDNLNNKVDKTNSRVSEQRKQMNELLK